MTRRQLTLFLNLQNTAIERIRSEFNPLQFCMIAAHVTLCREDEIEPVGKIIGNIDSIKLAAPLNITLGPVERFAAGKGVLIPANDENSGFVELRRSVLGLQGAAKDHQPHLTLMHPRNSTCTDEIFARIREFELPAVLSFDKISLIEQTNGGKWRTLREFAIC